MILNKKRLNIRVTDEELEYGLGFIMDDGVDNNSWANLDKKRFLSKNYLGYKTGEGKFYFEEKRIGSNKGNFGNNADFIAYELINNAGNYIELRWVFKKKAVWYIFFLLFLGVVIGLIFNFCFPEIGKAILSFYILYPMIIFFPLVKSYIYYKQVHEDLNKTIETRVRIREYHRGE